MKIASLVSGLAALACASGLVAGKAQATQILVGQCVEFAACYNNTTVWSDTLSLAQLTDLGLSTNVDFVATQTSQFVIRLGVTTADFTTGSGPVTETLPEYNGTASFNDPGPYQPPTVVGTFFIPDDATALTISGAFGNSAVASSAGTNLCLGSGPCGSAIPEPSTWAMLLLGFAGLGFAGYRSTRKAGWIGA